MGAWTDLPRHEIPAPEPIKASALATLPDFLVNGAAFVVVARARRSSNSRVFTGAVWPAFAGKLRFFFWLFAYYEEL
jgi:hypothetical protein